MSARNSRFLCLIMVLGSGPIGYSKAGYYISRGFRTNFPSLQPVGNVKREHLINKPVFKYAAQFGEKVALVDFEGQYKYANILLSSNKLANEISKNLGKKMQERVAFLCPNNVMYVITQWACWISGNIAVPLGHHQPLNLLEYYITDCDVNLLITTQERASMMQELANKTNRRLIVLDESYSLDAREPDQNLNEKNIGSTTNKTHLESIGQSSEFYTNSDALILYTSGSTGKPKGVVLSHNNLFSQISSLIEMWHWKPSDIILHTLPLNHIHGVVNALLCPFAVGARCIMLQAFSPAKVWGYFLGSFGDYQINIFMGTPTIYVRLLNEYDKSYNKTEHIVSYVRAKCSQKIRLMVSGSAALPENVFDRWKEVTGHNILERYGMTEIGMALSNPLHGERKPGFVGNPLPGVRVRIVHEEAPNKSRVIVEGDSIKTKILDNCTSGSLQVQGENVFKKYWGKPEETAREFVNGSWFKTGDMAQFIEGSYKILGRSSVDIIKSGGFKISALQIESVIMDHPSVEDVVIVGLPDITWGEKIAAVIKPKKGKTLDLRIIQHWVKKKLPVYMLPGVLKVVDEIPRNEMGKVNKKDVILQLFSNKNS